ncbi:hypothetical protein ACP70R_041622 [Stipagrostis hirtigluma subsp. patula]
MLAKAAPAGETGTAVGALTAKQLERPLAAVPMVHAARASASELRHHAGSNPLVLHGSVYEWAQAIDSWKWGNQVQTKVVECSSDLMVILR